MSDDGQREYERLMEERRRYFEAKREARRLKQGAQEAKGGLQEHPWVQANRETKRRLDETPDSEGSDARRPGAAAYVGLCAILAALLVLSILPLILGGRPAGSARADAAPPSLLLWHELGEGESVVLARVAGELAPSTGQLEIVRRTDIELALRRGVVAGRPPDLAVVEPATARRLTAWRSVEETLPLVEAEPWTRPLVVVVFERSRDEESRRFTQRFVRSLRAYLNPARP